MAWPSKRIRNTIKSGLDKLQIVATQKIGKIVSWIVES